MNHTRPVNFELFEYTRIRGDEPLPPAHDRILDVVVLDMNHGVANLGHDSLVHAIHESSLRLKKDEPISARVFSFDVRRATSFPHFDLDRFQLFIATGGPGHLDPSLNDGVSVWSEGVRENPSWEPWFNQLLDSILADDTAALIAFCHAFGLVCRWGGVAEPKLRSEESRGIATYTLTDSATDHPWFGAFAREISDQPRFRVLDSRLFDLIPLGSPRIPYDALAFEANTDGEPTEALTMIEIARDRDAVMPRIFAANHHPEVVDVSHLLEVLDEKLAKGEVTEAWRDRKERFLLNLWNEPDLEERMRRTSRYTLLDLLEFHLERISSERPVLA